MRISSSRKGAMVLVLMLSGCLLTPDRSSVTDEPALRTDLDAYVAVPVPDAGEYPILMFTVVARYVNRSHRTVYLDRCFPDSPHPIYWFRHAGPSEEGTVAYSPVLACVGHDNPIRVGSGRSRVDTLEVRGPNGFFQGGEASGVLEGSFRLIYGARSCADETGCELPDSLSWSNVFTVRMAQ